MTWRLLLFLGKNCYFCEEAGPDLVVTSSVEAHTSPAQQVPQAEKCFIRSLERYLRSPLRLEPEPFCYIQALFCPYWDAVLCITSSQLTIEGGFKISAAIACQDVFNQLGMLWCNRGGHKAGMLSFISSPSPLVMLDGHVSSAEEGMNFLRRAQVMYVRRPQHVRDVCEERCENNYTMTMSLGLQTSAAYHWELVLCMHMYLPGFTWRRPMGRCRSQPFQHAFAPRP